MPKPTSGLPARPQDRDVLSVGGQSESLPDGWSWFTSVPYGDTLPSRWYATSPYPVEALREKYGKRARDLCSTVSGETWESLHAEVNAQVELYREFTGGGTA